MYARTLIPDYVNPNELTGADGGYTPWTLEHPDATQLEDEALLARWEDFLDECEIVEGQEMHDFMAYLKRYGYDTPTIEQELVFVVPIGGAGP